MNDLPENERPREKALRYGIESLSNYELLAVLIGSGSIDNSANDIAYAMLKDSNGLNNLIHKHYIDLLNYKGVGQYKAIKVMAAFEIAKRCQESGTSESKQITSSEELFKRYRLRIASNLNQEIMYLVVLDKNKQIIYETSMYKGTRSSVNYSVEHIIKQVLIHSGNYCYIIHNHPSGDISPSEEDVFFTSMMIAESKKYDIKMLDHLIVSQSGFYSFLYSDFSSEKK